MSRIRGAAEYHLQITRQTTVEAICLWTGIKREDLLEANPDLLVEVLEEGQMLVVPAQALQADDEPIADLLFGEWPPSVSVDAPEPQGEADYSVEDEPAGGAVAEHFVTDGPESALEEDVEDGQDLEQRDPEAEAAEGTVVVFEVRGPSVSAEPDSLDTPVTGWSLATVRSEEATESTDQKDGNEDAVEQNQEAQTRSVPDAAEAAAGAPQPIEQPASQALAPAALSRSWQRKDEDRGYTLPEEPKGVITWRPFPKTIL